MTLKQLSCFPNLLPSLLPTMLQHCSCAINTVPENLLISCGWSWIGALSSSSSITSHVSCQGNHFTESTIKDSSCSVVVFFFCLDKSHRNVLLHQSTSVYLLSYYFSYDLKAIFVYSEGWKREIQQARPVKVSWGQCHRNSMHLLSERKN